MLALLVIAGCKMNVTSELYVSDIRDVAVNKTANMKTPGIVAVNIPSTDKCDEYTKKIMKILLGVMDGFSSKGCKSEGMDSYLILKGEFPLVHDNQTWEKADSLFGVVAAMKGNNIAVFFTLHKEKYKILNERMNKEFHQQVKLAESKLKAIVNNDERRDAIITANGVFIDGRPIHRMDREKHVLKRRQNSEIVMSNVGSAFMGRNGYVMMFVLESK